MMKQNAQIHYWAHMLDEVYDKNMLTEGKHWPEDYIKTAFNLIKSSQLGKQSWYSDEYIKKDLETIVNEFTPLSHKNSNLGFFMAIIRWFIEYSGTSAQKYQEFIEGKLDVIIKTLLRIASDKSFDSQRESIKKMPFADFEKLAEEINAKASKEDIDVSNSKLSFEIAPIYSYDELHDNYGGDFTGYKGESIWCHANGKGTYDSISWTNDGKNMFFVIQSHNWKNIKAPRVPYNGTPLQYPKFNCYDEYGMSLIAILVDVQTNKLLHSTSRWNHVILPKSGAADSMFESWQQLNKAVGLDVENFCKHECKELKKKLDDESIVANEQCANILKNAKIITDVTIPKAIRQKITEVVIPDGVTSIGSYAFTSCSRLKTVIISSSVTSIGRYAFYWCSGLTHVMIPDSVMSIGDSAFEKCGGLKNVMIPNSVTSIGEWAFRSCSSLTNVTIPDSVTSIGEYVFGDCSELTNVIIPDSVTSIGEYAFYNCSELTNVTIPNSVSSIRHDAFWNCSGLTSVTIGDHVKNIEHSVFENCIKLTSVTIPDSVTSIGEYAFYGCSGLKRVMIPNGVTRIDRAAFYKCRSLTNVTIPNSVTVIGQYAFSECDDLKSIVFNGKMMKQVKSMKNYPFGIEDESIIKCEDVS